MGFFGELKQDLSMVAGNEKKKEKADAEADRILADAEIAGLDEAESVMKQTSLDDYDFGGENDDVSSLLKDLVSDLGGEDLHAPVSEEGADAPAAEDDIDSILKGLMPEEDTVSAPEPGSEDETVFAADEASPAFNETPAAEAEEGTEEVSAENISAEDISAEEVSAENISAEDFSLEDADAPDDILKSDITEEDTDAEAAVPLVEGSEDTKETSEESEDFEDDTYTEGAYEMEAGTYSDETAVITAGMVVNGDVESLGSLDLLGKVNGDVNVKGKLNVTGHIIGNSEAKEIFAENAKITGNITSESSVKIGAGTVIIGNISAFSAAIAGAVKGDIDVHGPVILDSTAIVMGNIRSKSVQINNGAALEGVCSQAYAEVSPTSFFDDYKPETKTDKKARKKTEENN